jgi:hypothetical protein
MALRPADRNDLLLLQVLAGVRRQGNGSSQSRLGALFGRDNDLLNLEIWVGDRRADTARPGGQRQRSNGEKHQVCPPKAGYQPRRTNKSRSRVLHVLPRFFMSPVAVAERRQIFCLVCVTRLAGLNQNIVKALGR